MVRLRGRVEYKTDFITADFQSNLYVLINNHTHPRTNSNTQPYVYTFVYIYAI